MYEKVCEHLKNGGIVAYPTDTLYGLGVNPFDRKALLRLFELKDMEPRVISVAFPDFLEASKYAVLPDELAEIFPAPVTVIAEALSNWDCITFEGKIGIRIPDNTTALALLNECGPMTATSANVHGGPNLDLEGIKETFGENVMVVEGEEPKYMKPSTIVDIVDKKVIREGAFSPGRLFQD